MTKVTLPKAVAEAIDHYRSKGSNNASIITIALTYASLSGYGGALMTFVSDDAGNSDVLMSALVNGYEVESSPEDLLREYYEAYAEVNDEEAIARIYTLQFVLKTLGITVEGING